MRSLKQRFPYYASAMRLYPRAYYRRYSTQTLQTLADILDDTSISRSERFKQHIRAWFNLFYSIPKQRMLVSTKNLQKNPTSYVRRHTLFSLLLCTPLIVSVGLSEISPGTPLISSSVWVSPRILAVWCFILPGLATVVAIYTVCIWIINRRNLSAPQKHLSLILWLGTASFICLLGLGLLGLASVAAYFSNQQRVADARLSAAYQREHPSLACKLLPEASAQRIMAPHHVVLDNRNLSANDISGVEPVSDDIQTTYCNYIVGIGSSVGLQAMVKERFTQAAEQQLHARFNDVISQSGLSTISLQGYSGYYMQYEDGFTLGLWVNGFWMEVVGPGFNETNKAMQTMIANLYNDTAARAAANEEAMQRKIVPIPVTTDTLTEQDKTEISQKIVSQDTQPAGTEYNIQFKTIAGTQVTGTFRYQNGVHGTFAAKNQNGSWQIIRYKKQ